MTHDWTCDNCYALQQTGEERKAVLIQAINTNLWADRRKREALIKKIQAMPIKAFYPDYRIDPDTARVIISGAQDNECVHAATLVVMDGSTAGPAV